MRYRMAFLSLGLMAAAALLAMPAMAADPVPGKSCTTGNGWAVTTDGLIYDSGSNTTTITYTIGTQGNTPDHVGTFVRWEAGAVQASGSSVVTAPCGGDSVIGIDPNALCHESIVRFNNQQSKVTTFTVTVVGKRLPITTSVVVRKGNSQGSCRIVGFGLEDTTTTGDCVHQCGAFDPNQSIRKIETFKFKGCEVSFEFDTATGDVTDFSVAPVPGSGAVCTPKQGLISELLLNGGIISPGDPNENVTFGDGWISSGNDSCTTRLISGRYYTVCQ